VTEFDEQADVDIVGMAEDMGLEYACRVFEPGDLDEVLSSALDHDEPALVEAVVQRDTTETGGLITGAWHLPGLGEGYESNSREAEEIETTDESETATSN